MEREGKTARPSLHNKARTAENKAQLKFKMSTSKCRLCGCVFFSWHLSVLTLDFEIKTLTKPLISSWFHQKKKKKIFDFLHLFDITFHTELSTFQDLFFFSFKYNHWFNDFFPFTYICREEKHSLNTDIDTGYSTWCTEMTVLLFLEVCNYACMHSCTHILFLSLFHTHTNSLWTLST